MINFLEAETRVYPHRIAFNCLPHIDKFLDNGYTKEEVKMVNETRENSGGPGHSRHRHHRAGCGVFGHSEAVNIETHRACSADEVGCFGRRPRNQGSGRPGVQSLPWPSTPPGRT